MPETIAPERKAQKVLLPGQTPEGSHILSLLLKRTYAFSHGGPCKRAQEDKGIFSADVYHGDPMNSTVRFETDFLPYKLQTDVVFDGKAHSVGAVPVTNLKAALCVGTARKEILVIGDRVCRWMDGGRVAASQPAPFVSMDLRYENAYGGVDIYSDPSMPCAYPRNPLGKGFVVKPTPKTLMDLPLPNLEDPLNRITAEKLCILEMKHWEKQPMPVGFSWYPKFWPPRVSLAGIMPADAAFEKEMRKTYATLLKGEQKELYEKHTIGPMDFRFFNGAPAGQSFPYMSGAETIRLENLTPEGTTEFQLPGEKPVVRIDIGMGMQEPPVFLHTVQIRGEDSQVDLVWRAALPYPGPDWLPEMQNLILEIL